MQASNESGDAATLETNRAQGSSGHAIQFHTPLRGKPKIFVAVQRARTNPCLEEFAAWATMTCEETSPVCSDATFGKPSKLVAKLLIIIRGKYFSNNTALCVCEKTNQ